MNVYNNFLTDKNWKQSRCSSWGEWLNKQWYIHTTEYSVAFKRNELPIPAKTWMNLENMLNERSQS